MADIFSALCDNNMSLLKKLLDTGENVNKQDSSDLDRTILHKACIRCEPAVVKLILKYKPKTNLKDKSEHGQTPLHHSCIKGDLESVVLLLDHVIDINIVDKWNQTALFYATLCNHLDIVKLLLSRGADHSILTSKNSSLLHWARSKEVVKLLVNLGLDIHATNIYYDTPLTLASARGDLHVVQILCQLGSNINHRDLQGQTALHQATDQNMLPTVKLLLTQQPDTSVMDNNKFTALDIARNKGFKDIKDLITAYTEEKINSKGDDSEEFPSPVQDLTVEEGDDVVIKCQTRDEIEDVEWLKDGDSLDDHITASSTGREHTLHIDSVYPSDEGTYVCQLKSGEKTSGKLTVKALFADSPSQQWSKSEIRHMVSTCVGKIITAGKYKSGKTSLARTLLKGQACLCRLKDRTVVMNFTSWRISDGHTVPIIDVGGQDCYAQIAHYFHCNDGSNIVLWIHDIQLVEDADYNESYNWMRDVYTHSPNCKVLPVLTKSDAVCEAEIEARKNSFAEYMDKSLDKEINGLELEPCEYETKDISMKSKKELKMLVKALKQMKKRLQRREIHVVSCKENTGINILKHDIIKVCEKNKTSMPEKCHKLYQEIGLIGMKANKTQLFHGKHVKILQMDDNIAPKNEESRVRLEDVNDTQAAKETLESRDDETSSDRSNEENSVQERKHQSLNYRTIDAIYQKYCELNNNGRPTDDLLEEFGKYMSFLHSRGLLLWFEHLPKAKQIVFHDLNSFVLLLKTIFNHNVYQKLDFDNLTKVQRKILENSRVRLENDMQNLKTKGKMSLTLLKVLLERVGFHQYYETVADLLEKLNICTPIAGTDSLFLPWFCQSTNQPNELNEEIEKSKCCSLTCFAQSTRLCGYVPKPLFQYLCIFLYKFLGNPDKQPVYQWKDNMWIEAGYLRIHLYYESSQEVCLNTACPPDNLEAIKNTWSLIHQIHEECNLLRKSIWPGLINETFVLCAHCVMSNEPKPIATLVENLKDCPTGGTCVCPKETGVKLPAALFYPLPTDCDAAARRIDDLVTYLKRNAPAKMKEKKVENEKLEADTASPNHPKKSTMDLCTSQQFTQLETNITQRVQVLSDQMTTLAQGMSTGFNQMADQHRGLAHGIARQGFIAMLQSDDASRLPVKCQHPVLLKNQEMLLDNLNVDSELLKLLNDLRLITVDDRKLIEKDRTHLGKAKRVLFVLERQQPVKVKEFIEAMYECERDPNATLAIHLRECYDEFAKFQSDT